LSKQCEYCRRRRKKKYSRASQWLGGDFSHHQVIIRSIDQIDTLSQSCYVDLWYGAYSCQNPSATEAFQKQLAIDSSDKHFSKSANSTFPMWHVTLMNSYDVVYPVY
jgi:hypothetical protein